jgi:hypothetical protein
MKDMTLARVFSLYRKSLDENTISKEVFPFVASSSIFDRIKLFVGRATGDSALLLKKGAGHCLK